LQWSILSQAYKENGTSTFFLFFLFFFSIFDFVFSISFFRFSQTEAKEKRSLLWLEPPGSGAYPCPSPTPSVAGTLAPLLSKKFAEKGKSEKRKKKKKKAH
jgi:hypothetical protein